MDTAPQGGIIIYGGSFNPPHNGHLRIAVECKERLASFADRLEFLPAAAHPQKKAAGLLPFGMRLELIQTAINGIKGISCNAMERNWAGPAYTYDVLKQFAQSGNKIYFVLGSQDFALLPTWRNGLRLPEVCNLIVVPRDGGTVADFELKIARFWPDALRGMNSGKGLSAIENSFALQIPGGNSVYWLDMPCLEISASRIRELWLAGRSLKFLTPDPVIEMLNLEERAVRNCWEGE